MDSRSVVSEGVLVIIDESYASVGIFFWVLERFSFSEIGEIVVWDCVKEIVSCIVDVGVILEYLDDKEMEFSSDPALDVEVFIGYKLVVCDEKVCLSVCCCEIFA